MQIDIEKVKKGDAKAFQKLFQVFYPKLMSYASRFVDEHTAEDLVQELFTSYWEKKDKINADNILAFMYKWLNNSCLNYLKHQAVVDAYETKVRLAEQRAASMELFLDHNDVFKQMVSQDIRNIVKLSIKKLPPRCAEAFQLCYLQDMTYKEVAAKMQLSQRTVETYIFQAISFLRIELRDILLSFLMFYNIF